MLSVSYMLGTCVYDTSYDFHKPLKGLDIIELDNVCYTKEIMDVGVK